MIPRSSRSLGAVTLSLLVLSAGACNRAQKPATLPVPAVTRVAIPLAKAPSDDALLGYLRVRDPLKLSRGLFGDQVDAFAERRGLPLTSLRPGDGAAIFVWDPEGQPISATPVAAVLPVAAESPLGQRLSRMTGDGLMQGGRDGILAALNPPGMARATALGAATLWQVARSQEPGDLGVYVNLASLVSRYGPRAREALAGLAQNLPDKPATPGQPSPRAGLSMIEKLLDKVQSLKSLSFMVSLLPGDIEMATVVEDKQGQPSEPLAVPDLTPLLPAGEVRVQFNVRDAQRWAREYWNVYGGVFAEQPGVAAQLKSLMDDFAKVAPRSQVAVAVALKPTLRFYVIQAVPDAGALVALWRRNVAQMSSGPVHEMYAHQGIDMQISVTPAVRKLYGWPVDRYRYQVKGGDKFPPKVREFMGKVSEAPVEVMQLGNYVLVTMNDTADGLAQAVLTGRGGGAVRARAVYPAGGTSYGDVDLNGLWSGLREVLPPRDAQRMPELPAGMGPATFASFEGDGASYYRTQFPRALLGMLGVNK